MGKNFPVADDFNGNFSTLINFQLGLPASADFFNQIVHCPPNIMNK